MSGRQCTREQFDADTADHVMTVLLDNGIHRNLRFAKPGTYCMSFNIITWPGSLCITGDMGTYVFERLRDMFEFFRSPAGRINKGYWAEKVVAQCKTDGVDTFDLDAMVSHAVEAYREHWVDSGKWGMRLEGFKELRQYVFDNEDEGSFRAALNDFEWEGFRFSDTWEWNPRQYTFRFVWALYAIVYAIKQWDAAHPLEPAA
jgi:hypothetical protein